MHMLNGSVTQVTDLKVAPTDHPGLLSSHRQHGEADNFR